MYFLSYYVLAAIVGLGLFVAAAMLLVDVVRQTKVPQEPCEGSAGRSAQNGRFAGRSAHDSFPPMHSPSSP